MSKNPKTILKISIYLEIALTFFKIYMMQASWMLVLFFAPYLLVLAVARFSEMFESKVFKYTSYILFCLAALQILIPAVVIVSSILPLANLHYYFFNIPAFQGVVAVGASLWMLVSGKKRSKSSWVRIVGNITIVVLYGIYVLTGLWPDASSFRDFVYVPIIMIFAGPLAVILLFNSFFVLRRPAGQKMSAYQKNFLIMTAVFCIIALFLLTLMWLLKDLMSF